MQGRLQLLQALGKVHAFYRRGKGIFSLFFKIKHCLFCPFHKLSFPFSPLKAKCLHLMFCLLDRVHCKELDLAFLHYAQLLFHLSQLLQDGSELQFHDVNMICHADHIPFFLFHTLLFQKFQQRSDTILLTKWSSRFLTSHCFSFFHLHSLLPKRMLPKNVQQHHTKISFLLAFPWFCRHQAVQLRVLREAVLKWHKISGTADQSFPCAYIGDIGQLVLGNIQKGGQFVPVCGSLV